MMVIFCRKCSYKSDIEALLYNYVTTQDVVLVPLLLIFLYFEQISNIFSDVFTVNFEQVKAGWVRNRTFY